MALRKVDRRMRIIEGFSFFVLQNRIFVCYTRSINLSTFCLNERVYQIYSNSQIS